MPYSNPVLEGAPVKVFDRYRNNGDLMARLQAWRPDMFEGRGLDATYGSGVFWKYMRPEGLETNGGAPGHPADHDHDFRDWPTSWVKAFRWVVYDPPFRLNGKPDHSFVWRYGLAESMTVRAKMQLIKDGAEACASIVDHEGLLLVKCQDQVVSGARCYQTELIPGWLHGLGFRKRDEFHGVFGNEASNPRGGVEHAAQTTSTLLVLERRARGSRSKKWPVWDGGLS